MTEYAEKDVKVERCYFEWVILNFREIFDELQQRERLTREARNANPNKQYVSELEVASEEFMFGQHVQRTSVWQLLLRRKGVDLSASLSCLQSFHGGFDHIWTRFDVDIVDFDGTVVHSAAQKLFYDPENLTLFTPQVQAGSRVSAEEKYSIWETDIISMVDLSKKWNQLTSRNSLVLRLSLYIYREKPFNEAFHLEEFHEPVELRYSDHTQQPKVSFLCKAVRDLWETRDDADVSIMVEGSTLKAHKFIVSLYCPILKKAIEANKVANELVIEVNQISLAVFEFILRYMYLENVDDVKNSEDIQWVRSVLEACGKLEMKALARICLARLLKTMTVENYDELAFVIYAAVDQPDSYFKHEVKRFLMENQKALIKSASFKRAAKENRNLFLKLCFEPIPVIRPDSD